MSDYNVNEALGYLHVNKERALRKAGRLINCGSLTTDIFTAQAAMGEFATPTELRDALRNQLGTISIDTFNPQEIPSSKEVTEAAYTCLNVGYAFLSFLGQLWGLSPELALTVLAGVYDPVPGWSYQEVLRSIQGIFATVTLGLVAAATGGASVPLTLTLGASLIGIGASGLALWDQYQSGVIGEDEFRKKGILLLVLSGIDVAGIKVSKLFQARLAAALASRPQLITALDELAFLSLDSGVGFSDLYDSTLETFIQALQESGMSASEASQVARQVLEELQETARTYRIPLPSGANTYPAGGYSGSPGPMTLPIDVVNGIEASGPDNPKFATQPGEYSQDEILDVLDQYPDFNTWWMQRKQDLGYTGAQLEQAIIDSRNGIHDIVGDIAIPPHYYDLIWLRLLYATG